MSGQLLENKASAHISDLARGFYFPADVRTVNCCAPGTSQVAVYKLSGYSRADGS